VQNEKLFGLTFENIPLINLRMDFNQTYAFVFNNDFHKIFDFPVRPIDLPPFLWRGLPDDLMTVMLQRAILGVEAYLPGALTLTSTILGKASNELFAKFRNPFSFGARSAVVNIYHRMPAAVHPALSLQHLDGDLFDKTKAFYKDIRNPLFHGDQISRSEIHSLRATFDHLARVYEWIDFWCNPEKLIPGGRTLADVRSRYAPLTHEAGAS
jgi:hypothetical protein